jgi:hypothetical protein
MHLVLITSVVNPLASVSVFSRDERFSQLLESVDSVRARIPDAFVVVLEGGEYTEADVAALRERGAFVFFHSVNRVHKQRGEASLLHAFLTSNVFENVCAKHTVLSLTKLSGRYVLTDRFEFHYDGETCMCTVVPPESSRLGLGHMETRFYSMPIAYADQFRRAIERCCQEIFVDIEHSFFRYEALPLDKVKRLPKLHVGGYLAPTGEYVED